MGQLTIKDLYINLREEVRKGNGDKFIVVADDNEGNGFHGLFFGITSEAEDIKEAVEFSHGIYDSQENDLNKLVILG